MTTRFPDMTTPFPDMTTRFPHITTQFPVPKNLDSGHNQNSP